MCFKSLIHKFEIINDLYFLCAVRQRQINDGKAFAYQISESL